MVLELLGRHLEIRMVIGIIKAPTRILETEIYIIM